MPVDPHTWDSDFVTATLLDGDLYLSAGQMLIPNGIRFHARRPIYKSYNGQNGNNTSSGNWCYLYAGSGNNNLESKVIIDSAGLVAGWYDPNLTGNIRNWNQLGGGGTATTVGGLCLFIGYGLWPSQGGSGGVAVGFGLSTASTPTINGTLQAVNSAHQSCPIGIDLVDGGSQRWAIFGFNGSGSSMAPAATANADGSGWASRFLSHWVSVYPANGFTVTAAPAPLGSWSNSTTLTSALLNGNQGIRDVLRFLNMPPTIRADNSSGGSQSIPANTATAITSMTNTTGLSTYPSSFASNTFTAPFGGLYFVHGYVATQNFNGSLRAGVQINGSNYWGPYTPMPGSGEGAACKSQIFSLNAGDTVKLMGYGTGSGINTSTARPARLIVTCVSMQGSPSPLPSAPDTTYRWTAGTPGSVVNAWNAHVANDLKLLTQRPYLMAYQTSAQTLTPGTPTAVTMQSITGQVHGDAGDNYSGWSAVNGNYVAPVSGWYLAVSETFLAQPTQTSTPSVLGLFGLSPSGTDTWDRYQQQNMITGTSLSGASAVSYYYLRAGDTITPGVETFDSSSTTINTVTGQNSHFELVYLGE